MRNDSDLVPGQAQFYRADNPVRNQRAGRKACSSTKCCMGCRLVRSAPAPGSAQQIACWFFEAATSAPRANTATISLAPEQGIAWAASDLLGGRHCISH